MSMKRAEAYFRVLRLPVDALAVAAALLLSYHLRRANIDLLPGIQLLEPATTLPILREYIRTFVIPAIVLFLILAMGFRLYSLSLTMSAWVEVGRVLVVAGMWVALVVFWFFFVEKQLFYSRILLLHSTFFITLFVLTTRATLTLFQRSLLSWGIGRTVVASVGAGPIASIARAVLQADKRYEYLGHARDCAGLHQLPGHRRLDLVLQTDAHPKSATTGELIEECRSRHIGYAFLPTVFTDVPQKLKVERLGLLPMLRFQPTPLDGWGRVFKRAFDIIASAAALLLLSPIFLLITICVLLESGWPIVYVSSRVGEFAKRRIPVLKFRSMIHNADSRKEELLDANHRDGPLFKVKRDPRVTRVGGVLRRWTLDELPQLLNVFLGHMSLVGPRPHLPPEVDQYTSYQRRVFAVRPGMTGLAQISGRSDLKFQEEVSLDLQYVEEWSMLLDLWILWRTLFVVLGRDGAD